MKKKTFYTQPAPVLDPTIPCLGRDKPYTGTEPEFQKSSAGVVAAYRLDCAYHCPNETRGKKSKPGETKTGADINRMMLAGQGVRPGVSDWCIPHPTVFGHCGAYIELKVKKGSLSHDQIRFLNRVRELGYYAACVWNIDEFELIVKTLWPRIRPSFKLPTQIGEYVRTSPTNMAEFDPVTIASLDKTNPETRFSSAVNPELLEQLKQKYPADTKQGRTIRKIEAVASTTSAFVDALNQSDADAVENVIKGLDQALKQIQNQAPEFRTGSIVSESTNTSNWCHGLPDKSTVIEIRGEFIHSNGAELNGPLLAKAIGMAADWEGTYESDLKLLQEQNPGLVITIDTGEAQLHPDTENLCIDWTKPVTVIDFADPGHVAIAKSLTSSSIVRVINNPFVVGKEVPPEFDDMYSAYDYTNVPFWLDAVDLLVYGHRGNPIPDKDVCDKFTHQYITYLRLRP